MPAMDNQRDVLDALYDYGFVQGQLKNIDIAHKKACVDEAITDYVRKSTMKIEIGKNLASTLKAFFIMLFWILFFTLITVYSH